jgi:2-polyprenyl-3-methyl-5-hydroxy-6-metoxy-1,4-benzoquinol methylase
MQKDISTLSPVDLALVDEFHTRGRAATIDLARRAALTPGLKVLDIGCGLGGSARYLASEHGCRVTGIDLTKEYVDAANALAALVGMKDIVNGLVNLSNGLSGAHLVCDTRLMNTRSTTQYKHHRFPAEIISHGVWLYFRFCVSYRDVEE